MLVEQLRQLVLEVDKPRIPQLPEPTAPTVEAQAAQLYAEITAMLVDRATNGCNSANFHRYLERDQAKAIHQILARKFLNTGICAKVSLRIPSTDPVYDSYYHDTYIPDPDAPGELYCTFAWNHGWCIQCGDHMIP
jgi:hypothetical protein